MTTDEEYLNDAQARAFLISCIDHYLEQVFLIPPTTEELADDFADFLTDRS